MINKFKTKKEKLKFIIVFHFFTCILYLINYGKNSIEWLNNLLHMQILIELYLMFFVSVIKMIFNRKKRNEKIKKIEKTKIVINPNINKILNNRRYKKII